MISDKVTDTLRASLADLQERRAKVIAPLDELRVERDKLIADNREFVNRERALAQAIKAAQANPELAELDAQISRIAQALGGRRMSQPG